MTSRRNTLVYGMLLAIWAGLIAWQVMGHVRAKSAARDVLVEHARYVALTCGRIMRARAGVSGIISRERLQSSIQGLVTPSEYRSPELRSRGIVELRSVVLVNSAGEIAASAAATNVTVPSAEELRGDPDWDAPIVWLPNLVDLGTNLGEDMIVVVPRRSADQSAAAPATKTASTAANATAGPTPRTD